MLNYVIGIINSLDEALLKVLRFGQFFHRKNLKHLVLLYVAKL